MAVSESMNGMAIGRRLAELRAERGMTIRKLEERSGVPRSTIVDLEQGRRQSTRIATARLLAQGLDVPVTALMGIGEDGEVDQEAGNMLRVWRRLSVDDRMLVEDFARLLELKREAQARHRMPLRIMSDAGGTVLTVVAGEGEARVERKIGTG